MVAAAALILVAAVAVETDAHCVSEVARPIRIAATTSMHYSCHLYLQTVFDCLVQWLDTEQS